MINLIEPAYRRDLRIRYWIRVSTVAVVVFAATALVGAVALVPAYVLSLSKKHDAELSYQAVKDVIAREEKEAPTKEISALKEKLSVLSLHTSAAKLFSAIEVAVELRSSGIRINDLAYTAREKGGELVLGGVASTRDALLLYQKALQKNALFESVVLPVSNLAKDSDVEFTLTLSGNF